MLSFFIYFDAFIENTKARDMTFIGCDDKQLYLQRVCLLFNSYIFDAFDNAHSDKNLILSELLFVIVSALKN